MFVEQLKIVDILKWKEKYIEPGACDGTQWSVEIITDERTIKKYGDNSLLGIPIIMLIWSLIRNLILKRY